MSQPLLKSGLKPHHYSIAYMTVTGMKAGEIAKEVSMDPAYINQLMHSPPFQEFCQKIHWKIFGQDAQRRFKHILPKAIDTAENLMKDEMVKPSIRKDIAFGFMDRALGKPLQQVEVHTSSIKDLLLLMKERKKAVDLKQAESNNQDIELKAVHAAPASEEMNEVDKWVFQNFGET